MSQTATETLSQKSCKPCEGGVAALSRDEAERLLRELDGWELADDAKMIRRKWKVENFLVGIEFLQRVADIAERENHHPDLHLTGYRNVKVELTTHAIGGLSENDFIVAAKIDELPVAIK